MTDELVVRQAPWQDWYATQDAVRGVLFRKRHSGEEHQDRAADRMVTALGLEHR